MARTPRAWWWPSSVRARLTLGYGLAVALPLIAMAIGSYVVLDRALLGRTDHFLEGALDAFAIQLRAEEREMPDAPSVFRGAFTEFRFRDLQLVILDTTWTIVGADERMLHQATAQTGAGREDPPIDLRQLTAPLAAYDGIDHVVLTVATPRGEYRVHTRPVLVYGSPFRMAAVYPMHADRHTMADVRHAFVVAIPLLIALAALGGHVLAGRTLAPVAAMGRRAAEISASTLHERLPVIDPRDEFGRLALVVNALLARLEAAIGQQRRFMADASHELRTPAAIIRTETEVTLSRSHREEQDYRESAEVVDDAALRLTRIVDELFMLARADAGQLVPRHDRLDLADAVQSAGRAVRGIAEARGVRVELPPVAEAPFDGDENLIGRMLLNLIDNAIKFSEPGGTVRVTLARDDSAPPTYRLGVVDNGPGIPEDAQPRVFDRFFRVDQARSRSTVSATSGAGLGLAIARWAAEANGGRLELVTSRPGYTEFRATLPVSGVG